MIIISLQMRLFKHYLSFWCFESVVPQKILYIEMFVYLHLQSENHLARLICMEFFKSNFQRIIYVCSRDSAVGIATGYGLDM
jgi:hypothetical protein